MIFLLESNVVSERGSSALENTENKDLVEMALRVRPWDSFYFRLYCVVRNWSGTIFVLATAVPLQIEILSALLLLFVAVAGDLFIQKTAFDRRIGDLEFAERMIFRRGFSDAMGRGDRNYILRNAFLVLCGVYVVVPFALFCVTQFEISGATLHMLSEASLFLFLLSSLCSVLAWSRSIEAIPVVKTATEALDPESWTTGAEFGVGGPFAADALTWKHGAYLRWRGTLLLCCAGFLTLGDKVNFSKIAAAGAGQIYASFLAYVLIFLVIAFCIFSVSVLPWKMRGFALITLVQGRIDRFPKSVQRKLCGEGENVAESVSR